MKACFGSDGARREPRLGMSSYAWVSEAWPAWHWLWAGNPLAACMDKACECCVQAWKRVCSWLGMPPQQHEQPAVAASGEGMGEIRRGKRGCGASGTGIFAVLPPWPYQQQQQWASGRQAAAAGCIMPACRGQRRLTCHQWLVCLHRPWQPVAASRQLHCCAWQPRAVASAPQSCPCLQQAWQVVIILDARRCMLALEHTVVQNSIFQQNKVCHRSAKSCGQLMQPSSTVTTDLLRARGR